MFPKHARVVEKKKKKKENKGREKYSWPGFTVRLANNRDVEGNKRLSCAAPTDETATMACHDFLRYAN